MCAVNTSLRPLSDALLLSVLVLPKFLSDPVHLVCTSNPVLGSSCGTLPRKQEQGEGYHPPQPCREHHGAPSQAVIESNSNIRAPTGHGAHQDAGSFALGKKVLPIRVRSNAPLVRSGDREMSIVHHAFLFVLFLGILKGVRNVHGRFVGTMDSCGTRRAL
ncbi:hypothetical protein B0O80DRAFT_133178 [Mortierella sp. GBAus27b]|nr:hypothetical protein B0O80DRAFT_133178 [Mortierella sp. GBAus27b]